MKFKNRVLVVGDAMLDRYWSTSVTRISPEAPVPVALHTSTKEVLGGAANVAANCAALGADTKLLYVRGYDEDANIMKTMLQKKLISPITHGDWFPTIVKLRILAHNQQLLRVDFEKKLPEETANNLKSLFATEIAFADVVVVSDYAKGNITPQNSPYFIEKSKEKRIPVLVDPKGSNWTKYAGADLITPNIAEIELVLGTKWNNTNVRNLMNEYNFKNLLLTRSEEGMALFTNEGVFDFPTLATEVVDVCSAGDSVISTIAATWGHISLHEACVYASKAAAEVCRHVGTHNPTYESIFKGN